MLKKKILLSLSALLVAFAVSADVSNSKEEPSMKCVLCLLF